MVIFFRSHRSFNRSSTPVRSARAFFTAGRAARLGETRGLVSRGAAAAGWGGRAASPADEPVGCAAGAVPSAATGDGTLARSFSRGVGTVRPVAGSAARAGAVIGTGCADAARERPRE